MKMSENMKNKMERRNVRMGLFHCPVGAVMRGDEGCIECGLCAAATAEERVKATQTIREWLQKTEKERNKNISIFKIAICGKGGSGKSTLTALFAGALEELGYSTFVIDSDSSNGGLWKKLGMDGPPKPLSEMDESGPDGEWFNQSPMISTNFVEPYVKNNGLKSLVSIGKIEDPLEGDAREMGDYAKEIIRHMAPLDKEIILVDQEAGVESFGRGIEILCDTVLIPVEPSDESIELAGKVKYMAAGLGIRRVRAVLNKVEDEEQEEYLQEKLSEMDIRFLGTLPNKKEVRIKNMRGDEFESRFGLETAGLLVRMMLDEAQMKYK